MSKTYVFYVSGMTCTSCSGIIESYINEHLKKQSIKVEAFHADLATIGDPKKVTILLPDNHPDIIAPTLTQSQTEDQPKPKAIKKKPKHDKNWTALKTLITEVGFTCSEDGTVSISTQSKIKKLLNSHWFLGALGCISGISILMICLLVSSLPLAAMIAIAGISVSLTLFLGANSYYEAWSKLTKARSLTMDSLFALSTAIILLVAVLALIFTPLMPILPWLPKLPMMFDAALLIYGFRHIGIAIENTIKEKIGTARFQDRAAKIVQLKIANKRVDTPIEQIKPNDIIVISPGEIIPLDGSCENESSIYDTILTGATLPRLYRKNEKILAGMRLAEHAKPLEMRVSKEIQRSYLARLDARIEKAALDKAPIEIQTSKILTYFIPAVIVMATVSAVIISIFFTPALAIQSAVAVLVSACPCTLGLITPLAVKTGMHKAAENGVRFKSAKTLQQAEQSNTIIFDLNGTLTTGVPKIKQLKLINGCNLSEYELLKRCATLEQNSSHPIGKAIYAYSMRTINDELEAIQIDPPSHSGVSGSINKEQYSIGSRSLMQEYNIPLPPPHMLPELAAGDQLVFIAREQQIMGYIVMTDLLREDAELTIRALTSMKKEVHLCTGADEETAKRYAKALNIKHILGNCTPAAKTEYIKNLRAKAHIVTMIGDGPNDAEAVAASDFSIAMTSEGGDELTQQAAGAYTGCLLAIASAFAISKQTVSNIKQNLYLSLSYNLAAVAIAGGLLLAVGLTLNPAVGVILMILQACLILLNVFRFKEQPIAHLQKSAANANADDAEFVSSHKKMHQHSVNYEKDSGYEYDISNHGSGQKKSAPVSFWSKYLNPKPEAKIHSGTGYKPI
jgi:Cu2+-exporting ATPase